MALKWFISNLDTHKQCIVLNKELSDQSIIKTSMSQGSILGRILFLIYLNNLPLHMQQSKFDPYADYSTYTPPVKLLTTHPAHILSRCIRLLLYFIDNFIP